MLDFTLRKCLSLNMHTPAMRCGILGWQAHYKMNKRSERLHRLKQLINISLLKKRHSTPIHKHVLLLLFLLFSSPFLVMRIKKEGNSFHLIFPSTRHSIVNVLKESGILSIWRDMASHLLHKLLAKNADCGKSSLILPLLRDENSSENTEEIF